MSRLSDSINILASNVYGGRDVAVSLSKSPIELNRHAGPMSILDDDTFQFSSISYPRDVTQDMQNGHYMLFYINVQNKTKFKYEAADPNSEGIGETVQYLDERDDEEFGGYKTKFTSYGEIDASYRADLIKKGGKGTIISDPALGTLRKGRKAMTGMNSYYPTTTRITDSIAIYLPANVQDKTGVIYEGADMGVIGLAAATGGKFLTDMKNQDMVGAMKNLGGSAASLAASVAVNLGAKFVGGASELLLDVDAEALKGFAHKAFGQATNPYMEVLFQSVDLRTFSYNFTFSPRNKEETEDVQKIIKMFRFHMLPELKGGNSRYMPLPSPFDIHYMYQWDVDTAEENRFYSKIATCVLNNVEVDYTPGGVKSFADGEPTQITMALSFQETEMLTKQHVDKGY